MRVLGFRVPGLQGFSFGAVSFGVVVLQGFTYQKDQSLRVSNVKKIEKTLFKGGAGTGGKIKLRGDTGEQNGSPRNVGNFEVFKGGLLQRMAPKDLRTRNVVPCVCLDGVI